MDYSSLYNYDVPSSSVSGAGVATIASMFATYGILVLAVAVLTIVANWKIFSKAGEKGWKSLIPIYNSVILYKISGLSPWLLLLYLTAFIPVVGGIITFVLSVVVAVKLGQAFGKSGGFIVGLVLLGPIFQLILGFGSSQYVGTNKTNTTNSEVQ